MPDLTGKSIAMIIAASNFRDEELLKPKKIFENAGAKVTIFSTINQTAEGMLGARVTPDELVDSLRVEDFDAVLFVGGGGASQYFDDPRAHEIARSTLKNDRILGAICIAPVTLANAGVLKGKRATVFSSMKRDLIRGGATYTGKPVEVDGSIITADGPSSAEDFGKTVADAIVKK